MHIEFNLIWCLFCEGKTCSHLFLKFTAITTIEGVLKRTIMGLTQDQPVRKHMDPEGAKQIDDYVAKIESLLTLAQPFHVVR